MQREISETDSSSVVVVQEFQLTLLHFLEAGFPIYLQGFGILYPIFSKVVRSSTLKEKIVSSDDTVRSIGFEKCYDLVSFHREKYRGIVELRDVAKRIHTNAKSLLPPKFGITEIRKVIRTFLDELKKEVVTRGISERLSTIGDFYALHNRQGKTFSDWYAGADIFLKSKYEQTLASTAPRFLSRPVFHSPSEPFEALYGPKIATYTLDLIAELKELGYDSNVLERKALGERELRISVFKIPAEESDAGTLLYVSDGFRHFGYSSDRSQARGNEFTFQLALKHAEPAIGASNAPTWPLRLFTMAWILVRSSKSGTVKPGAGLSAEVSLVNGFDSELTTLFTNRLCGFRNEQLSDEGPFTFVNLTGITSDEAQVASRYSPALLLTLLEYKKLDQVTRPTRSSIVAKTGLLTTPLTPQKLEHFSENITANTTSNTSTLSPSSTPVGPA